ncbi:MAG: hypothetical protein AB1324_06395 [Candidatus Micrarchaeota archaeon]
MYTTSRYASSATRRLAKEMAGEAGEAYVARGKKSLDSLAAQARRAGEDTIKVVEEKGGLPFRIATAGVDALGRWRWMGERLLNSAGQSG